MVEKCIGYKIFELDRCNFRQHARKALLLTRVAGANVEDLIGGLNVLSDDILETGVALIPIELLSVLLVTVLPVF